MKYLGTHKNNEDLVPKSYVDQSIQQALSNINVTSPSAPSAGGGGQTQYAHFAVCDKYEHPKEEIEYVEEIYGKLREKRQIFTFHGGKKYDVKIIDRYNGLEVPENEVYWILSRGLLAYYKDGVIDFTSEPDNFTLTYDGGNADYYDVTFYLIREDLPLVCEGFMLLKDAPIFNRGKLLGIQVTNSPTASNEPSEYKWIF